MLVSRRHDHERSTGIDPSRSARSGLLVSGLCSLPACPANTMSMRLRRLHHAAIICSDYARSRAFYTEVLGLQVVAETFRNARQSWKLDLALPDGGLIELFSFPAPPSRPTRPEACGLRHLAFAVEDLDASIKHLHQHGVDVEPIRVDENTGQRYTFFADPDQQPLELYEG